jgi:hypothetical protein
MDRQTMIFESIVELRAEADEARHLASTLGDTGSIADLFKYAASLETDANFLELGPSGAARVTTPRRIICPLPERRSDRARVERVNASKIIQLPGGHGSNEQEDMAKSQICGATRR